VLGEVHLQSTNRVPFKKFRANQPQIERAPADASAVLSLFFLLVKSSPVQDEGSVSHQSAIACVQQPSHRCSHSFADPFAMRSVDRRCIAHTLHQRAEDRYMDQQPAEEVAVCGSPSVSSTANGLLATLGLWRGAPADCVPGLRKQKMTRQH
jgi:hypothetical protein